MELLVSRDLLGLLVEVATRFATQLLGSGEEGCVPSWAGRRLVRSVAFTVVLVVTNGVLAETDIS